MARSMTQRAWRHEADDRSAAAASRPGRRRQPTGSCRRKAGGYRPSAGIQTRIPLPVLAGRVHTGWAGDSQTTPTAAPIPRAAESHRNRRWYRSHPAPAAGWQVCRLAHCCCFAVLGCQYQLAAEYRPPCRPQEGRRTPRLPGSQPETCPDYKCRLAQRIGPNPRVRGRILI